MMGEAKERRLSAAIAQHNEEIKERARKLYKPPFRHEHGYIFDADHSMVADECVHALCVRGWGRLSYMTEPERLQDAVGELIAEALTKFWMEAKP